MIPRSPLNELVSMAETIVGSSHSEHSSLDSTTEGAASMQLPSQVQQCADQNTQSNQSLWKPYDNPEDNSFDDEFDLSAFDDLPISSLIPMQSSKMPLDFDVPDDLDFCLSDLQQQNSQDLVLPQYLEINNQSTAFNEQNSSDASAQAECTSPIEKAQFFVQDSVPQILSCEIMTSPSLPDTPLQVNNAENNVNVSNCLTSLPSELAEIPIDMQNPPSPSLSSMDWLTNLSDDSNSSSSIFSSTSESSSAESEPLPELPSAESLKESLSEMLVIRQRKKRTSCKCPNCLAAVGKKNKKRKGGEEQHICHHPHCGRVFNKVWTLNRHLKRHSEEKNFFCSVCDKGYARKDALDEHARIHVANAEKEVTCKCPNCSVEGGNTTRGPDGKLHHVCHYWDCRKIFSFPADLRRHLLRHENRINKAVTSPSTIDVKDDFNVNNGQNLVNALTYTVVTTVTSIENRICMPTNTVSLTNQIQPFVQAPLAQIQNVCLPNGFYVPQPQGVFILNNNNINTQGMISTQLPTANKMPIAPKSWKPKMVRPKLVAVPRLNMIAA